VPVTYLPFGVLVLDDLDFMSASYLDRRAALAELDSIIQDRRPAHHRPSARGEPEQQKHAECREKGWYGRDVVARLLS
jgi:hypothetical protein